MDLSIDVYVRESFPSGVCKIDSFIGLENLKLIIVFFCFPKIIFGCYWVVFISYYVELPSLIEDTMGHINPPVGQAVHFGASQSWFHFPWKN